LLARPTPSPSCSYCGEHYIRSQTACEARPKTSSKPDATSRRSKSIVKRSAEPPLAPCQLIPSNGCIGWHPMLKLANYQFMTWRLSVHVTRVVLGDSQDGTKGRCRVVSICVLRPRPCEAILPVLALLIDEVFTTPVSYPTSFASDRLTFSLGTY
jgi:hypothetical protein